MGRTKEISLGENLVKDIYYQKFGDHATNRVSTVWYGVNNVRKDSLKYTYDKAGNIETISENGKLVARYSYDGLNRLVREDNARLGTFIYRYDVAGNILSKSAYVFTLKDELGEAISENDYTYKSNGWKDQLLSFNGQECKYDALGNPLSYKGRTLAWQGRRLISYGIENKKATYSYDFNNVRTSKTATDGETTVNSKYIYDGNTLVAEQRTIRKDNEQAKTFWLYYIYGVDGIAGFEFEDKVYLYRKNVQGDITHIYTEDGTCVAKYVYDAWGNNDILSDTDNIGALNPFRYRGYYYDTETKLYYLISRYYDPETCRFISADGIEYLDPETLGGLNLYAYCCNNPVMMTDENGNMPKWLKWVIGIVAFVGAVVLTALTGGSLTPVFVGMAVSIVGSGLLQGTINAINGGSFWDGFSEGAADGALWGGIFALGGAAIRTIKVFKNGIAIGENMTRLTKVANSSGQAVYKGMPGFKVVKFFRGQEVAERLAMAHNKNFINRMMRWGVKISDYGMSITKILPRSPFYAMESSLTSSYWNLIKMMMLH